MELNSKPFDRDFETIYKGNRILVRNEGAYGERLYVNSVLQDQNSASDNGRLFGFLIDVNGNTEKIEAILSGTDILECVIYANEKIIYSSVKIIETLEAKKKKKKAYTVPKNSILFPFLVILIVCLFMMIILPFLGSEKKEETIESQKTEETREPKKIDNYIEAEYVWNYDNEEWKYVLKISEEEYLYYQTVDRKTIKDYSYYVKDTSDDAYMAELAEKFKEAAKKENYSDLEMVKNIIYFVQSLNYVDDKVGTGYDEYPKFPLETLADQGGDCEDSAILLSSLLRELGYGTVLIQFHDHMAVGVKGEDSIQGSYYEVKGIKYYYVETTSTGWEIGEVPEKIKDEPAKILSLN